MKTFLTLLAAALLFSSQLVQAGGFTEQCPDLPTCAKSVGEMLGQKYIFDSEFKGQVKTTPNLELTKETAETLFTFALDLNGYTRVPLGLPNTFQIIRHRDALDSNLPTVHCDAHTAPALPNHWDLTTLS
jgi:hypothetical protein